MVNDHNGTFVDWHLKLWGESKDASKATLLPMPTEEDDNDHALVATTTIGASTPTVAPNPVSTAAEVTVNPSDHPDRPVNTKPTDDAKPTTGEEETAQSSPSTWLPSFLPTFGVSASTQAWIYGSLGLIVAFCCGLGVYLWLARRKRLRSSPRDDYEFELLDEEEAEGLASGEKRLKGKKARRTRGGELYDAFAGGSDDEDDFAEDGYHDGGSDEGAGRRFNEKRGLRDEDDADEEEEHHVVGDDDEVSDDEHDATAVHGGRR